VTAFLEEVALANPMAGEDVAVVGPEDEKVVLSSVHQAKGLEWRAVFVIWLADGRFPSARALRVPGGIVRLDTAQLHEAFALTHSMTASAPVTASAAANATSDSDDVRALTETFEHAITETIPAMGEAASSSEAPSGPREIVIPGEEEERRLFYVAVTRAKQELYLVFPVMARERGGMDVLMEPSRFVRELPGDLYEKWVIGSE